MIECCICGKRAISDNAVMYPLDPKGTKNRKWVCEEHSNKANPDEALKEIVNIIKEVTK